MAEQVQTGELDLLGQPDEGGVVDDVEGVVVLVLDVLGGDDPDLGLLALVADVVGAEHDLEGRGVIHAVGGGQDPLLVWKVNNILFKLIEIIFFSVISSKYRSFLAIYKANENTDSL